MQNNSTGDPRDCKPEILTTNHCPYCEPRCPHCGRPYPYYQPYPYWTQPYYPYWPHYIWSGNETATTTPSQFTYTGGTYI